MRGVAQRFDRDGFVAVESFVDGEACDELARRALDLVAAFDLTSDVRSIFSTNEQTRRSDEYFLDSGEAIRCFFEPEAFDSAGELRQPLERSINKLGHGMHDLDPVFDRFSRTPKLAQLSEALGLGGHGILQSMFIFKQPFIGGEVTCHCDHTFLWTEPRSVVGFWFAIEDATRDNGCLWALPGGHRLPVDRRFRRDPEGGTMMDVLESTPYPTEGLVPLEVPKGTLVLLDGALPHLSGPNRSAFSRFAYTLHAIDPMASYPADNWLRRTSPMRSFSGETVAALHT